MIQFTCPCCNNPLNVNVLLSNPPIHKYDCTYCGWQYEQKQYIWQIPLQQYIKITEKFKNDIKQ